MKIGSLVECIYEFFVEDDQPPPFDMPVVGNIYKVRDIVTYEGSTGLRLSEITCPTSYVKDSEMAWNIGAFREIQPPMSISIDEIIKETKLEPA